MNEVIYVQSKRYVYFDNDGEITSISNQNKQEGSFVVANLEDVMNIVAAKEPMSNYVVMFDPITKQNVIRHRFIEEEIQFDINNQIYKVPTNVDCRPDFTLQQDIKNKRWNFCLTMFCQKI